MRTCENQQGHVKTAGTHKNKCSQTDAVVSFETFRAGEFYNYMTLFENFRGLESFKKYMKVVKSTGTTRHGNLGDPGFRKIQIFTAEKHSNEQTSVQNKYIKYKGYLSLQSCVNGVISSYHAAK